MKIVQKNPRKHPEKTDYSFIDVRVADSFKNDGGLCSARYGADLVADLDGREAQIGDVLDFGADGKFKVFKKKPCFDDDCPLRKEDKYCSLHTAAFFAEKIE